jgi:hypothetical protein
MKFITVEATADHMAEIAVTARQQDKDEAFLQAGLPLEQCLDYSYIQSAWVNAAYWEGKLAAVWGVQTTDRQKAEGSPWMVATDAMYQAPKAFMNLSAEIRRDIREGYLYLENHICAANVAAVRWLRWMHFTIHPAVPYGLRGELFHRFDWRSPLCAS